MNAAFRLLFRGGAWLPRRDAAEIARFGLQHLRAFKKAAEISVAMRQPRFPIHPKTHMLCHAFKFLEAQLQSSSAFSFQCMCLP